MATNEFIKTKAIDNAKRNAKKWIGYPQFAFITSGGLATATFLFGEQISYIDEKQAFIAALITGSSGLVGSYNHFNNLDKKFDIFIQSKDLLEYNQKLFMKKKSVNSKISIFLNIDNKLINLNMNNDYSLKSYKQLDFLKNSKKLDYNLDIS